MLGVIRVVKITMLDGICLITLKEDQCVVALLLVMCFSMFCDNYDHLFLVVINLFHIFPWRCVVITMDSFCH